MKDSKELEPKPKRAVAAVIYSPELDYILAGSKDNKWELIGAEIEPGENLESAVEREVDKKLGLPIKVRKFMGTTEFRSGEGDVVNVSFVECLPLGSVVVKKDKYKGIYDDLDWVKISEAPKRNWPDEQKEFIEKLATGSIGPKPSLN